MKSIGEDPKDEGIAKLMHFGASNSSGSLRLGQSPVLSHTLLIGFSVLLIMIIVTSMSSIKDEYQDFIGRSEITQVCAIVKGNVESIFWKENYISPMNETKGTATMRLPERIADMNYRAYFSGTTLFVETFGRVNITDTCVPGFNATYTGSTSGGITRLNFTEYSDGARVIKMSRA